MANDVGTSALLGDLRVVDLTDGYGALAGRVLADLGAEVVRIEVPGGGAGRVRAPRAPDGTGLHHAVRNVGKLVVTLDPSSDDDLRTLDGLLAGAEMAVVSDGWGADRGELTPSAISRRHPHLVVVSVTPYGLEGPAAGRAATELVAQSLAGVVYRSGVADLPPVSAPGSYCEDVGAVVAAMSGLIALHQAADDGVGQVVDVASILALAQCTEMALPIWSYLHNDQVRAGGGLYPLFPCRDGLARIVLPMSPAEWRSLIRWMGSPPEWTGPEWEGAMLGEVERGQIMARLPEMFSERTREEVTADADAVGVRVTPVLTSAEVLGNEHVVARGTFTEVPLAGGDAKVFTGLYSVDGERVPFGGLARTGPAPRWPARPAPTAPAVAGARPLAGLRVLEIGNGVAAPEAGRVLAEWGAEVIKVESRRRPDFQRMVMGGEMNPAFSTVARNKLAFGADMSTPAGRELVRSLVPSIDIVIENNATGVIDRLGLGWDALHAANPRLVLVSTQLYGDRGPWALRKGYGPSARAVGGLTWLWAHGPDAPRGVMTIHPDHLAGRMVAMAALSGVRAARRTGTGCRVDLAQFETVSLLLGDLLIAESLDAGSAVPTGNTDAEHAPWGLFRCADDAGSESWLAVCVTDDRSWSALVATAGGAIADDPSWRTVSGRLGAVAEIERALATWTRGRGARELEERLQAVGVAAGVALHPRPQVEHPAFAGRGYAIEIDQPGSGPLLLEGPAFTGSRMGSPSCDPAPALSQHTAQLCHDLLGMDETAVQALVEAGTVDAPPAKPSGGDCGADTGL
jgi:crotonobetainyl-CoA:carnitine CoA-transferase CaiB-like acyl-CoA transferase